MNRLGSTKALLVSNLVRAIALIVVQPNLALFFLIYLLIEMGAEWGFESNAPGQQNL